MVHTLAGAASACFIQTEVMEKPGNLPSRLLNNDADTGEHSGSDVTQLNKVRIPCRETRAGSKNQVLDKPWWRKQRYCHKVMPNSCKCATSTE